MFCNKKIVIVMLLILTLLLVTACSSSKTPPVDVEDSGEVLAVETIENNEEDSKDKSEDEGNEEIASSSEVEDSGSENEEDNENSEDQSNSQTSNNIESEKDNSIETENTEVETPLEEETQKPAEEKLEDKIAIEISGTGVDNSISISLEDMKAMENYYFEDDFFSLNSYGTTEYFFFKGIKLRGLLEKAGLKEDAKIVSFVASDGYEVQLTIEDALKEDYIDEQDSSKRYPIIIAWHENGKDYNAEKGLPFRLVIGQIELGDVNKPQWVQNIAKIIID